MTRRRRFQDLFGALLMAAVIGGTRAWWLGLAAAALLAWNCWNLSDWLGDPISMHVTSPLPITVLHEDDL